MFSAPLATAPACNSAKWSKLRPEPKLPNSAVVLQKKDLIRRFELRETASLIKVAVVVETPLSSQDMLLNLAEGIAACTVLFIFIQVCSQKRMKINLVIRFSGKPLQSEEMKALSKFLCDAMDSPTGYERVSG